MKNDLVGLFIAICLVFGVYCGYFVQDEGLNNAGVFITYVFSIIFILAIFSEKNKYENTPSIYVKIIARISLFLCVIALAYVSQYAHATIWLIMFLMATSSIKIKVNNNDLQRNN